MQINPNNLAENFINSSKKFRLFGKLNKYEIINLRRIQQEFEGTFEDISI